MTDETCCGACGYPIHATKEMACDWCRQSADRIEALEAKLAQAVEAKQLASDAGPCVCFACLEARALLAEIEGEKP